MECEDVRASELKFCRRNCQTCFQSNKTQPTWIASSTENRSGSNILCRHTVLYRQHRESRDGINGCRLRNYAEHICSIFTPYLTTAYHSATYNKHITQDSTAKRGMYKVAFIGRMPPMSSRHVPINMKTWTPYANMESINAMYPVDFFNFYCNTPIKPSYPKK
jgi:hypothetical protein